MRLATTADQAVEAAAALGYPVAMKIESPDILHKTEVLGVKLGLADEAAVRDAWTVIQGNMKRNLPEARIDGIIVQKMMPGDAEFVLGVSQDPVFGPVVMAGIGGVLVEVIKDVTFRSAPVTPTQAAGMLDDLRGRAILDGVRGKPPVDRVRLVELICAVSRLAAAAGPRLAELDLNPIMLTADGAVAVDWLIVTA